MKVLVPTTITDSMLSSSTIAEPAAGETAWVSAGTYALGDRRIRTTTHRIYECVLAHTARTALPEDDTAYWLDADPTAKWAAFDTEVSTQSLIATPYTVVLRPGFFNAVNLYGLEGVQVTVTVKDAPGGSIIFGPAAYSLLEDPLDWYDWAFGPIKQRTKVSISDIVPYPDAELTITVTAAGGVVVGVGMIVVGDFVSLIDKTSWGGTLAGATAEPVTTSYIKTDEYGKTKIIRRRSATDMRFSIAMPREQADYVLSVFQRVLDIPAAFVATDAAGFDGLNVFGLGSGSMSYDSNNRATYSGYVKGMF